MDVDVEGEANDGGLKGLLQDDDQALSLSAFETLEKEFQDVLATLAGDESLDEFRSEYEKVHRALVRSHDHERKLIKKVKELNGEIVTNASKVHTALKLSQDDQQTITTLRQEVEKAWALVDTAQSKETAAKETITSLKEEITNLSGLVEKSAKLTGGQETMVNELKQARDELQRQMDEAQGTCKVLETQLTNQAEALEKERIACGTLRGDKADLEQSLTARTAEVQRSTRSKERLDKELVSTIKLLEARTGEQEALQASATEAKAETGELTSQLSDARNTMDKYLRDYDTLYQRTQKLTEDLEEQITKNQGQHLEGVALQKELKVTKEGVIRLDLEKKQAGRKADREHRTMLQYKTLLAESKTPLVLAQKEIAALQKELDGFRKQVDAKAKEALSREREAKFAQAETEKAEKQVVLAKTHAREHENISASLEAEMNTFKSETVKQRKQIYQLEKERERYGVECAEQRNLYTSCLEEVKLRDMQLGQLQKEIGEWEGKLKQQQHLYEAVRSDRNLYSKNLLEAQDEISEMRRKSKIQAHQLGQLREEISGKDTALVKISFAHKKIDTQYSTTRNEVSKMKKFIATNEEIVHKQDAEIRRLASMIRRMDDDALVQRKGYDSIINERDILGAQLIRRNDEIGLVYEKLKLQHSTLRRGEEQYSARVHDVQVLRLKIRDMAREVAVASGGAQLSDDLRRELMGCRRDLLEEKSKVKALSEEIETPLNIHRWRQLEGSDPAQLEMIQKVQTLQKRLIQKTEEVVERDLSLQEKERLYAEVKAILARQPGPEVAEQLSVYQSSLRGKTRQMKSMASELNMYQAQLSEYKYEVERLTRELQDSKRKYYESKRRDQLRHELDAEERDLGALQQQTQLAASQSAKTRFTGGGFAIR